MLVFLSKGGIVEKLKRDKFEKAKSLFRRHGGMLRTSEAIKIGVHPRTLYAMADTGIVERLSRGLYRLADLPPLGNPDLTSVALKIPNGVICLISALAFHEITTQIPHEVYVALARGTEPPRLDYPPIRVFWFTGKAFTEGVETHTLEGTSVKVYSSEKTVVDCFKYRNKIGLDVAIEALKLYRQRMQTRIDDLIRFARICRVEKVIRPYLEALL
jgi:predicted transcriptional regulator of viral defense system